MQIFSASFVLLKTIKCICINNAVNDGHIILENNFYVRVLEEVEINSDKGLHPRRSGSDREQQ